MGFNQHAWGGPPFQWFKMKTIAYLLDMYNDLPINNFVIFYS